ncbi:MAG: hypothetical protein QOJ84_1583 [Bradyrhizobium sp.]|jgi:hypothetical protein|nr:hypothetical protein [Bradyrhizobium sp.]
MPATVRGKQFDVTIERTVSADSLEWPSAEELESETLGGNRSYSEVENEGWNEVAQFIEEESGIIESLYASEDVEAAHEAWMEDDFDDPALYGFDLGTNALTAALVAARCLPFYGCNGGAFGGAHNDAHPIVAFFCRNEIFPFIDAAAQRSNAGLEHNHAGGISVFGRDVDTLMLMASSLYDLRSEIDAVRIAARGD